MKGISFECLISKKEKCATLDYLIAKKEKELERLNALLVSRRGLLLNLCHLQEYEILDELFCLNASDYLKFEESIAQIVDIIQNSQSDNK